MNRVVPLLSRYAENHQNSTNRRIHFICVPLIQFSLLGLLWLLPLPLLPDSWPYFFRNVSTLVVLLCLLYYLWLSHQMAIGMLLLTGIMLLLINGLYTGHAPLFELSVAIFILAWIGQFIGHHIEGRRPSFFEDLRFLAIGPCWTLSHLYNVIGWISYKK